MSFRTPVIALCIVDFISGCLTESCKRYGTVCDDYLLHGPYHIWCLSCCSIECCRSFIADCHDYQDRGHITSGVYHVTPFGTRTGFNVSCDMATDDGGWLVFQRRSDGSEDFYREWRDYERGFGDVYNEFWLGLLRLKRILLQGHYELRIDLEDFEGNTAYAKYDLFDIGDLTDNYKLKVSGYTGTAGDSLSYHNGYMFSTKDKDNDPASRRHCAKFFKGAWWYKGCHHSNLNGQYLEGIQDTYADGVNWKAWRELNYSLKTTTMKIRRA